MTFFFEISKPWCWKLGRFNSTRMYRIWWGLFSIGWWKVPIHEIQPELWVEK